MIITTACFVSIFKESLQKKIRALEKEKDAKTEEIEDLKELCRRKDVSINVCSSRPAAISILMFVRVSEIFRKVSSQR